MFAWLQQCLDNPAFMPHGHCFLWTPSLLWLYVIADGMVVAAYFSIPPALWYFARKRPDVKYRWVAVLFGVFITACGTTHLIKIWNIWHGAYWLEAWVTLFTGLVSLACAAALWPILPRLLALPSSKELQAAYQALSSQHRQLSESENRYRLLLETAAEGVWLLDRTGHTLFANAAMAQILGHPDHLQGSQLMDFIYEEDREYVLSMMQRRLEGIQEKHELRFRRRQGSPVYTIVSASPVTDAHGYVTGVLGLVSDISDRVLLEQQLAQLNHELEQRVELRTGELEKSNRELAREVVVREYVQEELKASNEQLNHFLRELEKHNEDITRLNELSDQLHECNTRAELLVVLQRGCRAFFNAESGALFEWQDDELCLLESAWGAGDELAWWPQQDALLALSQGKLFPDCVEQQHLCADRVASANGFILCAPLHSRGSGVGALVLVRREPFWRGDSITDQKLEQIVRALAEHTALALNNLTLLEQLREQSLSDPLTGLYNRRYLYEQMSHEMSLWDRTHQPFALILLDIDHFKSFNDRYGHDVGDEVLVALADLLHLHVRKSDVACRLGGEEFVVLLGGADQKRALARAEAIRTAVKKLVITGVEASNTVSVSAGVAVYPDHGDNAHNLVRAADQALYESKRHGRDRTSMASAG